MLKIGTSGFSFPDWRGRVYPKKLQPGDMLSYYQNELGFDCVEINSTYYTLLSEKSFTAMESKTRSGFEFVVKAFKGITHTPFDPKLSDNKSAFRQSSEYLDRFLYSVQPLKEKNRLGALLFQFPVYFYPHTKNKEYILECSEKVRGVPFVVEFRNNHWAGPEIFSFLKKNNIAYCIVDEPRLKRLMPFINEVTSNTGYLRFHGRNPEWFNSPVNKRYDYFYSQNELKGFLPEIKKIEGKSNKAFIFFNNCHAGSAAKNALSLKQLLGIRADTGRFFD